MSANPQLYTDKQPDGTEVTLHIKGDESFNWMKDQEGYAVVRVENLV